MNDLRKKIFTTLFLVLSLLISCAFILVCVLEYSRTATQVQSDLAEAASRMEDLYRIFQHSRGSEDPPDRTGKNSPGTMEKSITCWDRNPPIPSS